MKLIAPSYVFWQSRAKPARSHTCSLCKRPYETSSPTPRFNAFDRWPVRALSNKAPNTHQTTSASICLPSQAQKCNPRRSHLGRRPPAARPRPPGQRRRRRKNTSASSAVAPSAAQSTGPDMKEVVSVSETPKRGRRVSGELFARHARRMVGWRGIRQTEIAGKTIKYHHADPYHRY